MWSSIGILTLVVVFLMLLILALPVGPSLSNCVSDVGSPLNMFLFQPPKSQYSDQLVNRWAEKPWRSDGSRIPIRVERYNRTDQGSNEQRLLIIYSHGNAENLIHCVPFIRDVSDSLQVDVMVWDYAGYGLNSGGVDERSPDGIHQSLGQVIQEALAMGYVRSNLIFWGYSLGTGPSIRMVSELCAKLETKPKALILVAPYSSIKQVMRELTSTTLGSSLSDKLVELFDERWNSMEHIQHLSCPTLILHGQADRLIPYSHGKRLQQRNTRYVEFVLMPGVGHATFQWPTAFDSIRSFFNRNHVSSVPRVQASRSNS
jgi:pimeloyl-ACP methyl ester carboxylesterase